MDVVSGKRPILEVFGNDYDTVDGSGVRDFIHVADLARGHLKALYYGVNHRGCEAFNLGSGTGYSVLQLIQTFSKVNNVEVNYRIGPRRAGDIPVSFADISKAKRLLKWAPQQTLEDMCRDAWKWQLSLLTEQQRAVQMIYPTKKTV